jgi:hypothetical protein
MRAAVIATLGEPPAVGDVPAAVRAEAHAQLLAHAADGALRVAIERVTLEDVAGAWTRQTAGTERKLVVEPRP